MTDYIISDSLKRAIQSLFDDPASAFAAVGAHQSDNKDFEPALSTSVDIRVRAAVLRDVLETYIMQMASEAVEIGCLETTDTLRMQAIGILIALRELRRHIPEVTTGGGVAWPD